MKYYYLFVLIVGINTHLASKRSELNNDQEKQIESYFIASDQEENAVTVKKLTKGIKAAHQIKTISNGKVMPMAVNDQFVKPVLKFGIPGKEPEYADDNESLRLEILLKSKVCYS